VFSFIGSGLPRRYCPSEVISNFASASTMRSRSACAENPPNTTEGERRPEAEARVEEELVLIKKHSLAGFFLAPVAATMLNERYRPDRELFLLPFAALISVFGVSRLWTRGGAARLAVLALCVASAIQFAVFYGDYLTDYRVRSESWFDPYDFRKISQYVVSTDSQQPVQAVYLSPLMVARDSLLTSMRSSVSAPTMPWRPAYTFAICFDFIAASITPAAEQLITAETPPD
jgi:hypothetical protein